jgi:hypothetical protein
MMEMTNGNLIVQGQRLSEIDLDAYTDSDQIFYLIGDIWAAVEKAEGAGEMPKQSGDELAVVFGQSFADKISAVRERLIEERESQKLICVKDIEYAQAHRFPIYRAGWEMDGTGWVVKTESGLKLVMSNHGQNAFVDGTARLKELIGGYEDVIKGMELALQYLDTQEPPKRFAKAAIDVDGTQRKVIHAFDVLWSGWASDTRGWVVKIGQMLRLVMSSHGMRAFSSPEQLHGLIQSYRRAIEATDKAIALLDVTAA